jgi:UDP-N-acetylmuramate dehydrogenase
MEILKDHSLSNLNTFGINAKAKLFVEITSEEDLKELFDLPEFKENKKMFLGGGSNVLFTKDFDGILVLNNLKGIEILKEDNHHILVRSMGGELWHDLVLFAVDKGYWGIENLSLIPGTVGAAPVQNIGAYGVEIKDTIERVETYDINTGTKKIFPGNKCEFGYRDSIFKNKMKGKYFISAVVFKLNKFKKTEVVYGVLGEYLEKNNIKIKNPKDMSDVVIAIRKSKLPDPRILGNAGSFFKNVFINKNKLIDFKKKYSEAPVFDEGKYVKIPAGWMIEQCGWKGKRVGNVGVHEKQALVLVNYGGATGEEIISLANAIIKSVKETFDLELVSEVNIV